MIEHPGRGKGVPLQSVLSGVRVLELGHYIAAPFCTRLLGDLGADVIKVEPLAGDPVRHWGAQVGGRSLWWSAHGRNKRSIGLNLKASEGRNAVLRLAAKCDVVVENYRPLQLGKMGLGVSELRAVNPRVIVAHISGYGQTGPYRDRAAFGVIGEAIGGLRYLTNDPPGDADHPPVRVGVSIGDSVAGIYAAFGVAAALWQRERSGVALTVDVALTESVLSLMEGMLPEYGKLGLVKQPTGGGISTAAPSNAYPCSDRQWILIAANSDPLFSQLTTLIGQPALAQDERFRMNPGRVVNALALDAIISSWTMTHTAEAAAAVLTRAGIPNTKAYTAADIAADPQFKVRNMVQEVQDPLLGPVLQCGVVPHFPDCPGTVRWTGTEAGHHGDDILGELGGYSCEEITALRRAGVLL